MCGFGLYFIFLKNRGGTDLILTYQLWTETCLSVMGSSLGKLVYHSEIGNLLLLALGTSLCCVSPQQCYFPDSHSRSYARTSEKWPSLQVQGCFSKELLPPYWEPGETCCVCHFLLLGNVWGHPNIPHLPFSGAENKH